jgi:hypothetical protein
MTTSGPRAPGPRPPAPAGTTRPDRPGSTPAPPAPPAPASPAGAGGSSPRPLAIFDPATRSWSPWPDPGPGQPRAATPTWPRCGTTRHGSAYAQPAWQPATAATGSSSSATTRTLPTPCARDGKGRGHQRGLPDLIEDPGALLPTPTARGYGSNRSRSAGAARRPSLARLAGHLLPTPRRSDAQGPGRHGAGGPDLRTTVSYLPTPRGSDGAKGSPAQRGSHGDLTLPAAAVAIDADHPPAHTSNRGGGRSTPAEGAPTTFWGPYTEAVERWQQCLGRPSPAPTQPGRHGRPVLAPRFVEWLMGLPDGWVTDLVLPRTVALRLLGNGVVPQQAAAALRALLFTHAQPAARL